MRILLTGGSGQVGRALRALHWAEGCGIVAPGRDALDLASPASVAAYLAGRRFDAILSVGAYTAVDRAEEEVAAAWTVNAVAPALLAQAAGRWGAPIVHVSTDYVFDGAKPQPYVETDPVGPLGTYGASKAGGEQAVRISGARHAILRTSWLVSATGANFARTMLRLGRERPLLRIVADQHGCPTMAGDLALALQRVVLRLIEDPDAPTGTYHACNKGETTWFGFAEGIFEEAARLGLHVPKIEAIAAADYPTRARRPRQSSLCADKLKRDFDVHLPPWRTSLPAIVEALMREAGSA